MGIQLFVKKLLRPDLSSRDYKDYVEDYTLDDATPFTGTGAGGAGDVDVNIAEVPAGGVLYLLTLHLANRATGGAVQVQIVDITGGTVLHDVIAYLEDSTDRNLIGGKWNPVFVWKNRSNAAHTVAVRFVSPSSATGNVDASGLYILR